MIIYKLKAMVAVLTVALSAGAASASAIPGVVVQTAPQVSADSADLSNIFAFFAEGSVSSRDVTTPVDNSLQIFIDGETSGPAALTDGGLRITDEGAPWLFGDFESFAVTTDAGGEDTIEILFGGLSGSAAGEFGRFALATIVGEFGSDPFGAGAPLGSGVVGSMTVAAAEIPLPAALPLSLGGLAALTLLSRRRRG